MNAASNARSKKKKGTLPSKMRDDRNSRRPISCPRDSLASQWHHKHHPKYSPWPPPPLSSSTWSPPHTSSTCRTWIRIASPPSICSCENEKRPPTESSHEISTRRTCTRLIWNWTISRQITRSFSRLPWIERRRRRQRGG
jgi:hypothetical protein